MPNDYPYSEGQHQNGNVIDMQTEDIVNSVQRKGLTIDDYILKTVDDILPFTKEDRKCAQKWMIKSKNRSQLQRILKTFVENNYINYRFEQR